MPIKMARPGAHGIIGMLSGLVVRKRTFCIVVKTAARGVIPNTRKKTRHPFVFQNAHRTKISELAAIMCSSRLRASNFYSADAASMLMERKRSF